MKKSEKQVIGRYDHLDFPELDLYELACKTDTGADSSSIHCHRVQVREKDGVEYLNFKLLDPEHPDYNKRDFKITDFEERKVRSSNGELQFRYVIKTKIVIFGEEYEGEFTLNDRTNMKFPVLLGRKLLKNNFIVDVSKRNLSLKQKQKSK